MTQMAADERAEAFASLFHLRNLRNLSHLCLLLDQPSGPIRREDWAVDVRCWSGVVSGVAMTARVSAP
jgi:hypothetical protein